MLRTAGAIPGIFMSCPDATSSVTSPFDDLVALTVFPNPGTASFTVQGFTPEAMQAGGATMIEVWDVRPACAPFPSQEQR
ncbi:MAG: hypothetical protein Q7T20_09590 [Saprospiraceae bacterium]|nr:hypothetical protein [Saprospiraceae bacterium]